MTDPSDAEPLLPLSVPHLGGNEWGYLRECLDTNWVSYVGPFVDRFERLLAMKAGAAHAVAVSSGTAALHVALELAGVGPDDEVLLPAASFIAAANAVRYRGAWPALVDIRPSDWQLDVDGLAKFLAEGCSVQGGRLVHRATTRRIAALLPVHLLGGMGDVDAVAELATKYELPVVEDAAECLGATYGGRPIGAPTSKYRGPLRLVITSFNGNKIVTTGGGGAIFTEDRALAERARHLTTTARIDPVEFVHDVVGYNYRMTNVAAALGVAQLEQLDHFVEVKRRHAVRYRAALAGWSRARHHPEPAGCTSTYWLYTLLLDRPSRPVIDALNVARIMARPVWRPLHRQPALVDACRAVTPLEFSEDFHARGICLPSSVALTDQDVARVADALRNVSPNS